MKKSRAIIALVFIASLSSLSYEITLVRIFSISLWYHFAFMVISIAMLGIGASGALLSVYPALKNLRYLPAYFLMLAVGIPLSYLLMNMVPFEPARLSWDRMQILYISIYYLLLSFPFFSFGLIISTALSTMPENTGHIYGADLIGAGAGSILVIYLLSAGSPERIVFMLSSVLMIPLFIYGAMSVRFISAIAVIINAGFLYFHPSFMEPQISPYKPLKIALKFPGAEHLRTYHSPFSRVDVFKSPAVRFAPGLSLRYLEELPAQIGISMDAGDINAITRPKNRNELDFISHLPASLPYEISDKNDVLILEPKGGLSALIAEYHGAKNIHKVDSNPVVIKAVREYSGPLSGVYDKNTWPGIGRSYLFSSGKTLDIIDISSMGSMPSGSFGFSEDYRFTVEAFAEYLKHLNPQGMLSINLFIIPPPRTELRLLNTLIEALEAIGLREAERHIAAIRTWGTITLLAKKSPLSISDIAKVKKFAADRRFDLIYYPGISEGETNLYVRMPSNEYFSAFKALLSSEAREQFIEKYIFDIRPVYDENPFFHYYLKLKNVREIYRLMGNKWQYFIEEGYLLPVIFAQVVLLSFILVFLPVIRFKGRSDINIGLIPLLAYFACLGLGFMFVEISFVQKIILSLENPSYAVAAVLASMLISSGIGSLLSQHFRIMRKAGIILVLSLIILLYGLFLPRITEGVYPYSLGIKIVFVFFILMPAGLLMGIPFPLGLSYLSNKNPSWIPWAWAINGSFSVLAPILAVMLAISAGFKTVILGGVLMYFFAFFALNRTGKT